jgi:type IV pilus assembly protein PilC
MVFQMKRSHEMAANIRSAMMYPTVILSAMVVVGILMATMVLPKLVSLFEEFDSALPLPTRILILVTNTLGNPLYLTGVILLVIACLSLHMYALKHSLNYQRQVHGLVLHLPIFGSVIKQVNLARFSLTLSSLLKSTIPIIDATKITADTCGNLLYKESLITASEGMKQGRTMSELLHEYPTLFPPMVTEMVLVGERTGEVEQLLQELAEFFSSEVDHTMKNFTVIIEPVIIVMLGLAVAGLAVAIIMPMYSLSQQF